jgi:acyl carrier protein phosphodiesterase
VNFVAHAVVAGRQRDEPAYAFGAMVPDLQRMAAVPLDVAHDDVAAGIASHHRADAAFHDSPVFKAWMATVVAGMGEQGRGARAAAHVAVELAIDGHLLTTGACGSYDGALVWAGGALEGRWGLLVDRMRSGEVIDAYGSADAIAARVVGVMVRRPRLAPITPDVDDLATGIAAVLPAIGDGAADVVEAVSRARG